MENTTNTIIKRENTFYCRTRRLANFLLENGATMKTIVPSVSDGRHGLAFIFEKNEIIDECMKRWETEKDTYRNPM